MNNITLLGKQYGCIAPKSGFRMTGYHVWCGSAIEVEGCFHLFASRWPVETGFPDGYRQHSEIVRAVADAPEGPYRFDEVVIGKRAPGRWDSAMAHNPAVYRWGERFVLYYIGSDEGSSYRQIGIATSASISGPWERHEVALDVGAACDANNPSMCTMADGRVLLIWRTADLRVCISCADAPEGPYQLVNDNVFPGVRLEDFFLFYLQERYHLLCEDNEGTLSGQVRWGIHLSSANGINGWELCNPAVAYDHCLCREDGSEFHPMRRERPWLLFSQGEATHLFTGVWDGAQAWNQVALLLPVISNQ